MVVSLNPMQLHVLCWLQWEVKGRARKQKTKTKARKQKTKTKKSVKKPAVRSQTPCTGSCFSSLDSLSPAAAFVGSGHHGVSLFLPRIIEKDA